MERDRILSLLERIRGKRIAVIGDYILDEYMIGDTGRVSREAPVAVVDYRESAYHPGGAANAAGNVASLGGAALSVGMVGSDGDGDRLLDLLADRGVDTSGVLRRTDIETALKLRILAGDLHAQKQQVARVDRLFRIVPDDPRLDEVAGAVERAVSNADGVLISDYGLGMTPGRVGAVAVAAARRARIPVVVDSRFDLLRFKGATTATPNEVEALQVLDRREGPYDVAQVAREIVEKASFDSLIITRGKLGMYVHTEEGGGVSLGIVGDDEVTDVTGAGDTVAAAVVLTLAAGGSILDAAKTATCAAAVVVGKRGTADVTPEEVARLLAGVDGGKGL